MRIYKITSPNTDLVYVGKTTQELHCRMHCHDSHYRTGNTRKCSSWKVLEHGDASIELLEETDDASREAYWIKELGSCNTIKLDGGVHQSKIDPVAYNRAYHAANREACNEYSRAYREANIDAIREYDRQRYLANKEEKDAYYAVKVQCCICDKRITRSNIARHQRSKSCLESKR